LVVKISGIKVALLAILCIFIFSPVVFSAETSADKSGSDVLARIGLEVITQKDIETALKKLPGNKRDKYRAITLDQLIEVKVFSNEARGAEIDKDPKIREALKRAENEILARHFINKYIDEKSEPSEEEMKTYYSEHKEQFVLPDGVSIQHVVVINQKDAEAILEKLKQGESFEEMAKKKSIASSYKNDGRLGWLYKGRMDPELEKVAFTLEKEKLSDVIKTKEGYQIIKVLEKSDKREIAFDEAKGNIRYELFWMKRKELIEKHYKDAKVDRKPAEKDVLFKIGDEAFKEELIESVLAKAPDKEKEKVRQRWVDYLLETTVFSREARKVGLEKDEEVASEINRRTDEVLASSFRKQIMREKVQVTDKDVEDYYQSNPEEFRIPVKVRARAIIVKTQEEAENIQKEIKRGVNFDTLAAKKSVYSAASEAVDMGWFGEGEKDPAIEKATFSLEKGQTSDIIKTEKGYQIIKVIEKSGGNVKPLNDVKEAIKMQLQGKKFQEEKQHYYEKAGVKIISTKN
jgi:EpsD family peptidyl-prolyl cis-trans isomerase